MGDFAMQTGKGKTNLILETGRVDVDSAVKALKERDARIFRIAYDHIRQQRLTEEPAGLAIACSTIYKACFDTIRRDSKAEAEKQLERAESIASTLKVLGVKLIPSSGYVVNQMATGDLLAIDPHFRSLASGLGGDLDVIRPITAMMQMVIDLREHAAYLQSLRKDRAFFYYIGKRFAEWSGHSPPVKVYALDIYRVLSEAIVEAGGAPLPKWPLKDYTKAEHAIEQGSKAACV